MGQEQGIAISIAGGLDKTSSSFDLFKTPGAATRLKNFEASIHGGYRRVDGYRKFMSSPVTSLTLISGGTGYASGTTIAITDSEGNGSGATGTVGLNASGTITSVTLSASGSAYQIAPTVTISDAGTSGSGGSITSSINTAVTPSGSAGQMQGIHAFKEGGWACQNGNIYWSEDGYTWIKTNVDYGSCSSGTYTTQYACELAGNTWSATWATSAQLSASGTDVTVSSSGRYQFTEYIPTGINTPRITATNGDDPISYLESKLDSGTRYFRYHRGLFNAFGVTPSTGNYVTIPRPQYCVTHDDHVVASGWSTQPETVYYSTRYDDADYNGASAGSLNVGDSITGLKTFRSDLVIFSRSSINKLININTSDIAVVDVTRNIGCLDGFSIQEIGGDLVFLAPDGIRTVAATERIDDIELSSISHKIIPIINDIVNNINTYDLSSAVIRTQNQYRLFYNNSSTTKLSQKGIVGTFKISPQGVPTWEWAELQGLEVSCFTSNYNANNIEQAYHGDYDGYVHFHNKGNSFDGDNISAEFKTPDIDYGDIGIRKTLHFVKLSIKPEGGSNINMDVRYDFEDADLTQPATFPLGTLLSPSLFGTAIFGTSKFGSPEVPMKKVNVWGSGFSNSFKFHSNDSNPPYSIQGMYIDLIPSGRR